MRECVPGGDPGQTLSLDLILHKRALLSPNSAFSAQVSYWLHLLLRRGFPLGLQLSPWEWHCCQWCCWDRTWGWYGSSPGRWLCWGQSRPPVKWPEILRGFKHWCSRQAFWENKTNPQNSSQRLGTRPAWGGWVSSPREGQGWPPCSMCSLICLEENKWYENLPLLMHCSKFISLSLS